MGTWGGGAGYDQSPFPATHTQAVCLAACLSSLVLPSRALASHSRVAPSPHCPGGQAPLSNFAARTRTRHTSRANGGASCGASPRQSSQTQALTGSSVLRLPVKQNHESPWPCDKQQPCPVLLISHLHNSCNLLSAPPRRHPLSSPPSPSP